MAGFAAQPYYALGLARQGKAKPRVTAADDATLAAQMVAAQAGDQRAYQAALRSCAPIAARVARRRGVAPDRVDDVVQDVLLTIHRALPTYDPARPFMPWLYAIADRRAIDCLRVRGRQGAREVFDPLAYEMEPAVFVDADAALDGARDAARLREAIAKLPAGQRQAVETLGLAEHSLEDAAGLTGRNKVALKVNLHRALKALRQHLAGTPQGRADE